MSSRERILTTLKHQEPDRIPFDMAGTIWSGISETAYQNLLKYLGLPLHKTEWSDVIQQIVMHIKATGMDPFQLKKDFGKDIVFWGGGIDTQKVLPSGSRKNVEDDVKRNIDALAPGGGFVFTTVHNIQSEVPPENIMTMRETVMEYGRYR